MTKTNNSVKMVIQNLNIERFLCCICFCQQLKNHWVSCFLQNSHVDPGYEYSNRVNSFMLGNVKFSLMPYKKPGRGVGGGGEDRKT